MIDIHLWCVQYLCCTEWKHSKWINWIHDDINIFIMSPTHCLHIVGIVFEFNCTRTSMSKSILKLSCPVYYDIIYLWANMEIMNKFKEGGRERETGKKIIFWLSKVAEFDAYVTFLGSCVHIHACFASMQICECR